MLHVLIWELHQRIILICVVDEQPRAKVRCFNIALFITLFCIYCVSCTSMWYKTKEIKKPLIALVRSFPQFSQIIEHNVDRCLDKTIHSVFCSVSCSKLNENNKGKHLIAQSNLMFGVRFHFLLLFIRFYLSSRSRGIFFSLNFHEIIELFKIRIVKSMKQKYIQK